MTNLQRWLLYLLTFLVPYFSTLAVIITTPNLEKLILPIQVLPYIVVLAFGLYATTTVLYRTFTFNDCPEAAKELYEQIEEARKDLKRLGFKFDDKE